MNNKLNPKKNEINSFSYINTKDLNPYMPKKINSKYYNNITSEKTDIIYLATCFDNFLLNEINSKNVKKINKINFEKGMLYCPLEDDIVNYDNNVNMINDKIKEYDEEISRVTNILNKYIKWIKNKKIKTAHICNNVDQKNNQYDKVMRGKKERASYMILNIDSYTNDTKNFKKIIKEIFKHNFEDSINGIMEHYGKFVLNMVKNMFDKYIDALKYSLKILKNEPNTINFNLDGEHLTKIDLDLFQSVENQYIKINFKKMLKNVYYIDKYDKKQTDCKYIKFAYMNGSHQIDIIFE